MACFVREEGLLCDIKLEVEDKLVSSKKKFKSTS